MSEAIVRTGEPVLDESSGRRRLAGPTLGWWVAGVAGALYAALSLARYAAFRSRGYDLGLNYQLVQSYARFQLPHSDIVGRDVNLLGDHFSPAMALLAPVYWVWQDPRALLLAQAALVALSIVPVHRFTRRHLGGPATLAVTIGYALGWPLQAMVAFDVHEVMFAVPLLAFAVDAVDRRADRTFVLLCLGLVLVKEDMGLVVIMLGLVRVLVEGRRGSARGRRVGFAVVALGVLGYVVAAVVVIPALSARGGVTHWSYDALGPDLGSALVALVLHPLDAAQLFLWSPPVKAATLFALFVPTAFLCFRSPFVLAVLPLLAERFFSSSYQLWGPYYHYSATAWPIIVLAAVHGASRLQRRTPIAPRALAVTLCGASLIGTAVLPSVFAMNALLTGRTWAHDPHADQQRAILARVPVGSCVEADDSLAPYLLTRNRVSEPGHLGRTPDFIAVDRSARVTGVNSPAPGRVETAARAAGFTVVVRRGPLALYRSPDYAGPSAHCRP